MNMRIGIDASRANNIQKTGVEWYAYFLIEHLKKIGTSGLPFLGGDVEFILYSDKPLTGDLAILPEGWSSKVLKWPPKRFWTQIRLSWEMLMHPPDVLFVPAHVFPVVHPKKTVMTIHDVAALRHPEGYNWFERWYSLWSARRAMKKLWRIIVPSEFTKNELCSMVDTHSVQAQISVVYHGFDTRYAHIKDTRSVDDVLETYGAKAPFALSVGRLEEKKNTRRIVEAFNHVRMLMPTSKFQLLLVGKPGHGFTAVERQIQNSPFRDDIIIPGWVDDADLPLLMCAAEIFIFPSLYEGFGLPILEAFACGTPVVASKGNSLEEVGSNAAIFVDPKHAENIADAIILLLTNTQLRDQRIGRGIERAHFFSWEKSAEKTRNILFGVQ